jgi:ATP-dependent Clp protease ATP-binding subunit ClpA
MLKKSKIDLEKLITEITDGKLMPTAKKSRLEKKELSRADVEKLKIVKEFTNNLVTIYTSKLENNTRDLLVERPDEVKKIINILLRLRKNNPMLVGEPGVGKTAVVEG